MTGVFNSELSCLGLRSDQGLNILLSGQVILLSHCLCHVVSLRPGVRMDTDKLDYMLDFKLI